jgi:hypothetical protein
LTIKNFTDSQFKHGITEKFETLVIDKIAASDLSMTVLINKGFVGQGLKQELPVPKCVVQNLFQLIK